MPEMQREGGEVIYGFTGTRHGASSAQLEWLPGMLHPDDELHHGACIGADRQAHHLAIARGLRSSAILPPMRPHDADEE